MGAMLRLSKAVLYRTRRRCLASALFAALRHRGLRLWLAPKRASLFAAASRPDVSRRRFITTLADPRSEYAALGAKAGRRLWSRALGLGTGCSKRRTAELRNPVVRWDRRE